MQFEPLGGFPPLIRVEDIKPTKTSETRGFGTTNIVSISNIMDSKKKENLFIAFGSEDEDGNDLLVSGLFDNPHDYNRIIYKDIPNTKPKKNAKKNQKKS